MKKIVLAACCAVALSGCATPYQEMGLTGGVRATQITADTFQITARGNAYTDPDTIQQYVLRKAAETTIGAGYELFLLGSEADRTRFGSFTSASATRTGNSAYGFGSSFQIAKPGETVLVKMLHGPKPDPMPPGLFDAREVAGFLTPKPKTP